MVRCFLVVVIFLPSNERSVEIGFYMRKIWEKHDDILLVLTVIALWTTNKTPRCQIVYKVWEVCNRNDITTLALHVYGHAQLGNSNWGTRLANNIVSI